MLPATPTPARLLDSRWLGAALLATVVVLRTPAFAVGIANIDECDFALFGRMVEAGAVPYVGVADIKPPLLYLIYHATEALFGRSFDAIRVLGIGSILATALLVRAAARAWTGDDRAGWAAAFLSVLAIVCESPAVNAEILMNVPIAAALLLLVRAERTGRLLLDVAVGAAIGVASLVKHQAAIAVLALFIAHVLLPGRGPGWRSLRRVFGLALGFSVPWLAAAAIAASQDWPSFYYWVVTRNLYQASGARVSSVGRGVSTTALYLAATTLPWWLALRSAARRRDGVAVALVVVVALTCVAVSAGGRFYEHYFLQFAPPLALLGGPELVVLLERWGEIGRVRRACVVALAVLPLFASVAYATARAVRQDFPGQNAKAKAIAEWLRSHTAPDDRVFMWGDYSVVYCLADRLPGTRYMRTAPLVGDFDPEHLPRSTSVDVFQSARDIDQALRDLAANRPAVVVDTSPADLHGWSRFPLSSVAPIARYVHEHYALVAHPAGAAVYLRRTAAPELGAAGP